MKKIFLIISVTLFFCNSVFADWEKFGDAEEGAVYYVEKDTIIKESGYIYFWKMVLEKHWELCCLGNMNLIQMQEN